MFRRVVRHVRGQPVAFVALFLALGGGAVAASTTGEASAGAVLTARINGLNTAGSRFGSPSGTSGLTNDESLVSILTPAHNLVARDLSVQLTHPATGGSRKFYLVVNGTTLGFDCQIHKATTCRDTTHAVSVPASSTLSIQSTVDGETPRGDAKLAFRLTNS